MLCDGEVSDMLIVPFSLPEQKGFLDFLQIGGTYENELELKDFAEVRYGNFQDFP